MSDKPEAIELDPADLTQEAIRGLAESFVAREGTDYGLHEKTWDEKVQAVLDQIERGEARIVFDPESESATLIPRR